MRGAVEAIAADLIVLVVFVRDGIGVCHRRHGLVERSVEHSDLGNAVAQSGLAGVDADDVGRVVQGSQGVAAFDGLHDFIGDEDGGGECFAAMNHTVADSVDLAHGGDDAVFRIDQGVQDSLDGFGMGGHSHINGVQLLLAVHLGLVGELAVNADPFAQALGQQVASSGIQQLILQGGAACVDNQNIHSEYLLFHLMIFLLLAARRAVM